MCVLQNAKRGIDTLRLRVTLINVTPLSTLRIGWMLNLEVSIIKQSDPVDGVQDRTPNVRVL